MPYCRSSMRVSFSSWSLNPEMRSGSPCLPMISRMRLRAETSLSKSLYHASLSLMNTKLWASSHIPMSLVSSQIFLSSIAASLV